MKALRYLLIVMGLMSVLSISAQALAQEPQAQMQSTSIMAGSGSQLPSAAAQGTYVTGTTIGTYNPANVNGPHRAKKEDNPGGGFNPGGGEPGPGDNSEPWEDPLGDAAWPLMLLAFAFAIYKVRTRKRVERQ
jgi:hypothetical protein